VERRSWLRLTWLLDYESHFDQVVSPAYARHMPREKTPVGQVRHVKLFRNGRNQAVRIPRDLELPGNVAVMYREGARLVIEPTRRPSLSGLLASWSPLEVGLPAVADVPPEPVDLGEP
jgi:antitoxin VapB